VPVREQDLTILEAKLKHLEFIQAVIARMAQNSFLFKGWAITIAAGLSALGAVETKRALLGVALASTVMFWGLDGYYLWLERAFIKLYCSIAQKPEAEINFQMRPEALGAKWWMKTWGWAKTCARAHLILFYGTLLAGDVVSIFFIRGGK
jgi:hypothetical protein